MARTRIKMCGMMRLEDAVSAAAVGADAIGMIFHPPARRNLSLDRARQIVDAVGPFVTAVGVFVDAPLATIADITAELGIRVVQLHGRETAEQVEAVGKLGLTVLKAVRVDDTLGQQLDYWRKAMPSLRGILHGIVLETADTAGGSGKANDWPRIAQHQANGDFDGLPPLIAAGGLDPDSVATVVRAIHPWAVDVSSGIETHVGVKTIEKMKAFVDAVQSA